MRFATIYDVTISGADCSLKNFKMASNVLVLLVLLCSLMSAHCHHDGAPEQACFTMQPAHNGTTPLSITNPIHKINFAPAPALKDTNSSR